MSLRVLTLCRWALIALILHLAAALLSSGFYHPDEQFQVLEFLNAKLGRGVTAEMPLEYGLALRSWLQPGFLLLVNRALEGIGLHDPFVRATVFRLISALLGWSATVAIAAVSLPRLKTELERRTLLVLSAFLFYLPALHARTSSENWGGAVFFLGLAVSLLSNKKDRALGFAAAGALFGLAYGLRFQTAFLTIGAFAWWVIQGRARPRELLAMILGGLTLVGVGACVDRWGYGYWTSPAWNYFRHTLVEGHVNDNDTGPLWDFVRLSFTESWPILGTLVFASFFVACFRRPKDPFVWSCIPLMAVHHLIAHKELRFLFPIAQAGPLWLALAAPLVKPLFLRVLLAYNCLALVIQSTMPASARIALFQAISKSGVSTVYYRGTDDPYSVQGITSYFYRPDGLVTLPAPSDEELLRSEEPFALYYLKGRGTPSPTLLERGQCSLLATQMSEFVESWLPLSRLPNIKNWQLLRCVPQQQR